MAQIENSEQATGCTGSYCGLFQLSQQEFTRHGGTGSRFDPEQNTMAAANKMAQEARDFKSKYGRDAELFDIYMIHQQGSAGYDAHMQNPDAPAWQNMYSTGEGKQKGAGWSKLAIIKNTPGGVAQFGGVENVTSQQFMDLWNKTISKGGAPLSGHEPAGMPKQAGEYDEEHEAAGLPSGAVDTGEGEGGKRTRAGRGAADAAKDEKSLLNQEDVEPYKPNIPKFQVPDLVPKFTGV
jgi:hypothetical protein